MKRYALLGRKIGYSRSPIIHSFLARQTGVEMEYRVFQTEVPESALEQGFDGFNITIPYKQSLLGRLSSLDPVAARIGAVNTVKREEGLWKGYNTDYEGFGGLLERAGIGIAGRRFAILGTGGAARGAAVRLLDGGAEEIRFLSRSAGNGRSESVEFADAEGRAVALRISPYSAVASLGETVFVNATPLGTDPNEDDPLPGEGWAKCVAAVDLVYNPFLTPFLREAVSRGIPSADGLDMLAVQACRAFEIWQGMKIPKELEDRAVEMLRLKAARGIALVGMPLSGKSTILASLRGEKSFPSGVLVADLDDEIEKEAGKPIPSIFALEGEPGFRRREHEALAGLVAGGHVIACGGGALTRPENLALLKNSLIVHVEATMEELKRRFRESPPGARPLLSTEADIESLYARRQAVYRSASRARSDPEGVRKLIFRWLEVRECE